MNTISLKRLGNLIAMFFFGWVTYATAQGTLQEMIYFAGVANEIGFFCMSASITFIFAYLVISK